MSCSNKNCGCTSVDLFGKPGEGLGPGAIPFILGNTVTGAYEQADLQEYIPQSNGKTHVSQRINVNSDGTSPQAISTVTGLAPFTTLRIRGLLRVNNTSGGALSVRILLPSVNFTNSGTVVGWYAPNGVAPVSFFDSATPGTVNPQVTFDVGQNVVQFEHRFVGISIGTSSTVSVEGVGSPTGANLLEYRGIIDYWIE